MGRTPAFRGLKRLMAIARYCDARNLATEDGLAEITQATEEHKLQMNRRELALGALGLGTLALTHGAIGNLIAAPATSGNRDVGIVGAGLAGLVCADQLKKLGVMARLYEASDRCGGRVSSIANFYKGQTIERGGELIDNLHKTMIGYAREFGLDLEDVNKNPGETFYHFNGQKYPEVVVVTEYRAFVEAIRGDLRSISGEPDAITHTDADVRLDLINLQQYLEGKNSANLAAGPVVKEAIIAAYLAEYGLAASEQSCLGFLLFIHADKRSRFQPFGVFSDERYHLVQGNDGIAAGLSARLPGQIEYGMSLVKIAKSADGRVELTFKSGNRTIVKIHDQVVIAIPFTVLRGIEIAVNVGLPKNKVNAIQNLGYGNNAKMMVAFTGRPWSKLGSNGASYSNLANHQTTWETNWTKATDKNGVIVDYSSAARGLSLKPTNLQSEVDRFVTDLNKIYPGASNLIAKANGQSIAHMEAWPSNPLTKGSYTCYKPGQFTTIAGLEGQSHDNLHFAGEHANSFYVWQGFMEGACLSGIDAAKAVMQNIAKRQVKSRTKKG